MKNTVNQHINKIQQSISWVNSNLTGEKRRNTYSKLVDYRRSLNRINLALEENPAAAIYGESQTGKSYLVSSLLSTPENPFHVLDNSRKYNFILEMNPRGDDAESTGVVTRFSLSHDWTNNNYPIKVKMLSVADIILMLCDTYYNDVKAHNPLSDQEIEKEITQIENLKAENIAIQNIIQEDDILDIRDYFKGYLKSKAVYLENSSFFEKISLIINRFDSNEWGRIFSLLWNKNEHITNIFNKLIQKYKELDFVQSLYVPFDAVHRKYGTLLDVKRLPEIYDPEAGIEAEYNPSTDIFYINRNGEQVETTTLKSYLSVLAAELIFRVPEELKSSKPFLEKTDLLDFPGARARLENYENNLCDELIPQMILRGKVAFLFNKYSDNYRINTLLFCHGKKQSSQRLLPELINRWICNTMGDSPEIRQKFISTSKISPLFVICTMFNLDLIFDQNDKTRHNDAMKDRWVQRFTTILEKEIFNIDTYNWLNNWTSRQQFFQNLYLLRDFYYSSEEKNQLFKGFNTEKREIEEMLPVDYPNFRNDLRKSFINYEFVEKHFNDPINSWDRAASINEDGSELIIQNLTIAAKNINNARIDKFVQELNQLSKEVVSELEKHFHSQDSDKLILKAKETAGDIQFKLDINFGRDPYSFGKMMKRFVISEGEIYNLYREKLQSIELTQNINIEQYSAIRLTTPELNITADFETNLKVLCEKYMKPSVEVCKQDFEKENIDLDELFYGNINRIKSFSTTLAESLQKYWFDESLLGRNYNELCEIFSESTVNDIVDMLKALFIKLHLTDKIATSIRKYVDRYDNIEEAQEMIADISAEIINKFITTIGYFYFTEENIEEMRVANINNDLGLNLDHNYLSYDSFSPDMVSTLFEVLDNLPDLLKENPINQEILKNVPSFSNYKKWRDLIKFGFISVCDIPNYDLAANEQLGVLKKELEEINYK